MTQSQSMKIKVLTGIDLVKIDRFRGIVEKNKEFNDKFFHKHEYHNREIQSIASIFAAKEAIIKTFGEIKILKMKNISIEHLDNGKPTFSLINDKIDIISKDLSISHTEEHVIASVVVLINEL